MERDAGAMRRDKPLTSSAEPNRGGKERGAAVERLAAELRACRQRLETAEREASALSRELEQVLERSNTLAVEAELTEIELNQVFNASADGMWVIDSDFRVQRVNAALLQLLNRSREEAIGQKCHQLLQGSVCRRPGCPMTAVLGGEQRLERDIEVACGQGGRTPYILTASPFSGLDGQPIGLVEAFKDISARKQAEEQLKRANQELERMATVDGLTQVANRRRFDEYLDLEWKRSRRENTFISLLLCDIDFFKRYNDHYGHQAGDDCLRAVAQVIRSRIRRPADLVARYGGEEFAVILPNTPGDGALHVAEMVRRAVDEAGLPHRRSAVAGHVTLSVGAAGMLPQPENSAALLVQQADRALYRAKEQGRNRVAGSVEER